MDSYSWKDVDSIGRWNGKVAEVLKWVHLRGNGVEGK